jgi:hypothetical protein
MEYSDPDTIQNQADARCGREFARYDGLAQDSSAFSYDEIIPNDWSWSQADRLLVCIAYLSTDQYPNGAPVDYSIKGSNQ